MGRLELAVPIISTQLVTDTMGDGDTLAPLLGATAVGLQCRALPAA
jgi:hypothetical protein